MAIPPWSAHELARSWAWLVLGWKTASRILVDGSPQLEEECGLSCYQTERPCLQDRPPPPGPSPHDAGQELGHSSLRPFTI